MARRACLPPPPAPCPRCPSTLVDLHDGRLRCWGCGHQWTGPEVLDQLLKRIDDALARTARAEA